MPHACTNHRCSKRSTPGCGRRVCQVMLTVQGRPIPIPIPIPIPATATPQRQGLSGEARTLPIQQEISPISKYNTYVSHPESTTSRMISAHKGLQMDMKIEGDATGSATSTFEKKSRCSRTHRSMRASLCSSSRIIPYRIYRRNPHLARSGRCHQGKQDRIGGTWEKTRDERTKKEARGHRRRWIATLLVAGRQTS